MAHDPLNERVLAVLTHLCALTALGYTARASVMLRGLRTVPELATLHDAPSLSVVVPARNEERNVERCVRSLLAQTLTDVEVIVVDDRSTDRTAAILAELAGEQPRLRIVPGEPLPDGWVGKPWAVAQGERAARGEWLLFTDADTWHAPHACASALAFARAHRADALTLWTYQELGTWSERAVLPTLLGMVLLASGPIAQLNDPADRDHALANGQYVLVTRAAHDALGGFEALRGEIVEDVAFAHRLKADGRFRLVLADGHNIVRVRMYTSLRELWNGFSKNMYAGAKGDLRALSGGIAFLALLSVVPAALAVDGIARKRPWRALEALLCLANGVAVQTYGIGKTGIPRRYGWYAPLGYAMCGAIMLNSTLRVVTGRGVEWRGRRYTGRLGTNRP
ncbi:MAG TPA: glycosyltransferase family 2 protein [Candidatus Elarobacter sp.]|nr:glycosyltransferase family 2 protein [Candidatus Elarobacter sp.]HEV2738548.1 glycosyltransferase family 2 protein [Candidatus Elarobacter sp.]